MGREPPKPELIKRHNHALIEIAYKSKQSGETKVFRGSWTTLEVREDGTYFVEVYDETDGSIRIADTADGGVAKNHKLTTLGPLEKLDVYGLVKV